MGLLRLTSNLLCTINRQVQLCLRYALPEHGTSLRRQKLVLRVACLTVSAFGPPALESLEVHRALPLYELLLLPDSDIMFLMTVKLPRLRAYRVLSLVSGQSLMRCTPMRCTPMKGTPVRYTPMRHTPKCILMRYTPVRCTPVRRPPMRCTLVGCTPVRYTPTVVWPFWGYGGAGVVKGCPGTNVFTLASDDDVDSLQRQ
jgi:hypothetical protein